MSTRLLPAASLTLLAIIAILQGGAAARWWEAVTPEAAMLTTLLVWLVGLVLLHPASAVEDMDRQAAAPFTAMAHPPSAPLADPAAAVAPRGLPPQRRRSPRFALLCPVTIESGAHGPVRAELRDISQGGARIAGGPPLAPDAYGLLRIEGISLPIPFTVLQQMPEGGELRVRFELSDLGLDTFCRQLDRLVDVTGARSAAPALAAPFH